MAFYDNLLTACARENKKPSNVAVEIGLSPASVTAWKKGSVPQDSTLAKLAECLNCTTTQLKIGFPETYKAVNAVEADNEITKNTTSLDSIIRKLCNLNQKQLEEVNIAINFIVYRDSISGLGKK